MSDLFRQSVNSVNNAQPRPGPQPIHSTSESEPEPEVDERPPSSSSTDSSSSSSADSSASVNTVRPSSSEKPADASHWTNYFAQELFLQHNDDKQRARYHVYLTPPSDSKKGPLFICHHGAGASGLSFAIFARHVKHKLPEAGILSLEARGHGGSIVTSTNGNDEEIIDFSIPTLSHDALTMIHLTESTMSWPSLPPIILIGHSLGGAIVTDLAFSRTLGPALIGFCVLDVVEGSALEALSHMKTYLSKRPSSFTGVDEAIEWHTRTRTIRCRESAEVSVPSLLTRSLSGGDFTWLTDLSATAPWWESWFIGLSSKFLQSRGAKLLILAGTDRLDKDLMIGQMQGKFQLVVLPEAGHFVQEDVPERTAEILTEFWRRNDRSQLVLPPKVSELLAMGKKV